jgi:hypothetical protein
MIIFLRKVLCVTILLVWTHRKDDVSLKINTISALTKLSCLMGTVIVLNLQMPTISLAFFLPKYWPTTRTKEI